KAEDRDIDAHAHKPVADPQSGTRPYPPEGFPQWPPHEDRRPEDQLQIYRPEGRSSEAQGQNPPEIPYQNGISSFSSVAGAALGAPAIFLMRKPPVIFPPKFTVVSLKTTIFLPLASPAVRAP